MFANQCKVGIVFSKALLKPSRLIRLGAGYLLAAPKMEQFMTLSISSENQIFLGEWPSRHEGGAALERFPILVMSR